MPEVCFIRRQLGLHLLNQLWLRAGKIFSFGNIFHKVEETREFRGTDIAYFWLARLSTNVFQRKLVLVIGIGTFPRCDC